MSLLAAKNCRLINVNNEQAILYLLRSKRCKTTSNDDYEYMQKSKIPTMHFQPSLPRLPIPKLEDTCRRYLNAQRPLLSEEQMVKTKIFIDKFLKEEGIELHNELVRFDKANRHTSYISGPWSDMYLRDRRSLPINYNPFLIFVPETDVRYNQQLVKATNLVVSSIRFLKSLRANILEPEVFHLNPKKSNTKFFRTFTGMLPSSVSWYGSYLMKAYPLDMSQYANLFNSTRIPEKDKDRIAMDTSGRHVVVMRRGRFYAFDVLDEEGNIYNPHRVATNLQNILRDERPPSDNPVGVLTASERDLWASTRSHITEIGNKDILKKIDSAAFILVLEDETAGDQNNLLRLFLHGKAENRWFDKSFSLIVTKDGYAGLNFEHAWGDGVAVLRYFQDLKKDISENPQFHPEDEAKISSESSSVEKLEFKLDAKVKDIILQEQNRWSEWTKTLDLDHLIYEGFGKNECKGFGVSPDAIMQLVFQLAFYKQESRSVATYESCSTSAFKHGRTETIRPCTLQTKNLCLTMTSKSSEISLSQLKNIIIDCSNAHMTLTKEAAMGQGFDRHLFALRKIAEKQNKQPQIYQDPNFEMLNHNILSTSTLSSPVVLGGGFGPVVDDGFGIGYMIQEKKLGVVVTSYRNHRSCNEFVNSLESSFKDIHKVLLSK